MRRIREVLRLKHEFGLSERAIATSTGMSKSAAHDCICRADKAGLTWEQASKLADGVLESRLFVLVGRNEPPTRAPIELAWVRQEMRKAGVTLQLVWTVLTTVRIRSRSPTRAGGDRSPGEDRVACGPAARRRAGQVFDWIGRTR